MGCGSSTAKVAEPNAAPVSRNQENTNNPKDATASAHSPSTGGMPATIIQQMTDSFGNFLACLDKAEAFAAERKFESTVFVTYRLVPDMYPFSLQIQSASNSLKDAVAHLSGDKSPPTWANTESSISELRERIKKALDYAKSVSAREGAYAPGATVRVPLSFLPGKGLLGPDYLVQLCMPNFYFHLSMAYAILRECGVDLGKADFIGRGIKLIDV